MMVIERVKTRNVTDPATSTPRKLNDEKRAEAQDATGGQGRAGTETDSDGRGTDGKATGPTTPQRPRTNTHMANTGKGKAKNRSDETDSEDGGAASRRLFDGDGTTSDDGGATTPDQRDMSPMSSEGEEGGNSQELLKDETEGNIEHDDKIIIIVIYQANPNTSAGTIVGALTRTHDGYVPTSVMHDMQTKMERRPRLHSIRDVAEYMRRWSREALNAEYTFHMTDTTAKWTPMSEDATLAATIQTLHVYPTGKVTMWTCDVCNTKHATEASAAAHRFGQRHQQKIDTQRRVDEASATADLGTKRKDRDEEDNAAKLATAAKTTRGASSDVSTTADRRAGESTDSAVIDAAIANMPAVEAAGTAAPTEQLGTNTTTPTLTRRLSHRRTKTPAQFQDASHDAAAATKLARAKAKQARVAADNAKAEAIREATAQEARKVIQAAKLAKEVAARKAEKRRKKEEEKLKDESAALLCEGTCKVCHKEGQRYTVCPFKNCNGHGTVWSVEGLVTHLNSHHKKGKHDGKAGSFPVFAQQKGAIMRLTGLSCCEVCHFAMAEHGRHTGPCRGYGHQPVDGSEADVTEQPTTIMQRIRANIPERLAYDTIGHLTPDERLRDDFKTITMPIMQEDYRTKLGIVFAIVIEHAMNPDSDVKLRKANIDFALGMMMKMAFQACEEFAKDSTNQTVVKRTLHERVELLANGEWPTLFASYMDERAKARPRATTEQELTEQVIQHITATRFKSATNLITTKTQAAESGVGRDPVRLVKPEENLDAMRAANPKELRNPPNGDEPNNPIPHGDYDDIMRLLDQVGTRFTARRLRTTITKMNGNVSAGRSGTKQEHVEWLLVQPDFARALGAMYEFITLHGISKFFPETDEIALYIRNTMRTVNLQGLTKPGSAKVRTFSVIMTIESLFLRAGGGRLRIDAGEEVQRQQHDDGKKRMHVDSYNGAAVHGYEPPESTSVFTKRRRR